jgi:hypothetical protein
MEADVAPEAANPGADALRCLLAALPHSLFLRILGALPVDARARAAAVCRAWRDALAGREAWRRLDLSTASGVPERLRTADFLRAAAARAHGSRTVGGDELGSGDDGGGSGLGGGLTHLDLTGLTFNEGNICEVLTAHARTLREMYVLNDERMYTTHGVRQFLTAAPSLTAMHANISCHPPEARAVLHNEAPYEKLCMQRLSLVGTAAAGRAKETVDVLGELSAHASLTGLQLAGYVLDRDIMDAAVDAARQARLRCLALQSCGVSPAACVAPLARLLAGGVLRELVIGDNAPGVRGARLLDAPSAVLLGDALRVNASITRLHLCDVSLWWAAGAAAGGVDSGDAGAGVLLLAALTGHASLRVLMLDDNDARRSEAAAGAALGALVAANAPALTELSLCNSGLGDVGLAPLMDALGVNTHLRTLDISCTQAESEQFARMSAPFARQRLMPAVLGSRTLRELRGIYYTVGANEAVTQLRRRERARG